MGKTKMLSKHVALGMIFLTLAVLLIACGDSSPTPAAAPTTVAAAAVSTTSASTTTDAKGVPAFSGKPINMQVIDVCGCLQLAQNMMDNYKKANPDKVGNIEYLKATAPELTGKIKAQQDANKLDITFVLSGYDGMAAGVEQGLWTKLSPDFDSKLTSMTDNYSDPNKKAAQIAQNYALPFAYTPSGPLFEYDATKVQNPPKTIDELKAWMKANPNKFEYARPANSGPGRTFLMGLPYILGDKDPKDPINGWDKTWAFLKEIDQYIEYYPSGTSATMKELADGTRSMIASTVGWDINPRVLGTVPKEAKTFSVSNFHWVSDNLFMMIPKGLDNDHLAVSLDLMGWMLKPDQQAYTYDSGYFYPGPAIKGVDISAAPVSSQNAIKDFGRPEYADLIKSAPVEMPLDTKSLNAAFSKWDKEIGGAKVKK